MTVYELSNRLSNGGMNDVFSRIYGNSEMELLRQRARYLNAAEKFSRLCPECEDVHVFSASGRTEIGGNHTDHQHGCVLAAAVTPDILAFVTLNEDDVMRFYQEDGSSFEIDPDETDIVEEEKGTTAALVRGILRKFAENGVSAGGFDAYITSELPVGAGISSSAAFEVLIATIVDHLFSDGKLSPIEKAKFGQYAENTYFGKSCGLMDQLVCAVGGFVSIDLKKPKSPDISPVSFDLSSSGYALCLVDTKGDHTDMSDDYSQISEDMVSVARVLGVDCLGDADEDEFYDNIPEIREKCSDRAILRAGHFFDETKRAVLQAEALSNGDLTEFFDLVNKSGDSSAMLLENLYSPNNRDDRELMLATAISRRFLNGSGAVRVHGGGFAGTIQAFVPNYMLKGYIAELDAIFGQGSTMVMNIRNDGCIMIV